LIIKSIDRPQSNVPGIITENARKRPVHSPGKKTLLKINKWRYKKIAEKKRHSSHRAEARCIESDAGYEGPSGADFAQQIAI
jgi:hypothetical protein